MGALITIGEENLKVLRYPEIKPVDEHCEHCSPIVVYVRLVVWAYMCRDRL